MGELLDAGAAALAVSAAVGQLVALLVLGLAPVLALGTAAVLLTLALVAAWRDCQRG